MKPLFFSIAALGAMIAGGAHAQGHCREYSQSVTIGGQQQRSYGTACMQPDGSWQVVSQNGQYRNHSYPAPAPAPVIYSPPPVVYAPPPPRPVYYSSPGLSISFGYNDYYRHKHHRKPWYKRKKHWGHPHYHHTYHGHKWRKGHHWRGHGKGHWRGHGRHHRYDD